MGWTISGGRANATACADGNGISQPMTLVAGQTYDLLFTILDRTSGVSVHLPPCFASSERGATLSALILRGGWFAV